MVGAVRAFTNRSRTYRGHLGNKGHGGTPRAALPSHDVTGIIEAHEMQNLLSNLNPEYAHLWHGLASCARA